MCIRDRYNAPIVAGAALHFDGTDDFINVPDANVLDLGTTLTLEAWVKPTSFGTYNMIIDKRASNDAIANYGLTLAAGKPMFYFWSNSSDPHFHTATNAISLNTWTHIAATYDGARVKLCLLYTSPPLASCLKHKAMTNILEKT